MIPNDLRPLFWDIKPEEFDPARHPEYTIARILEYGDEKAVTWLRMVFSEGDIRQVIRTEARLSPRSANFWALVYRIPADQVAALSGKSENVFPGRSID